MHHRQIIVVLCLFTTVLETNGVETDVLETGHCPLDGPMLDGMPCRNDCTQDENCDPPFRICCQYDCHKICIDSKEKKLIKKLLDDYQEFGVVGRPVYNRSTAINVEYGIGLIQILDMNEKDQKWVDVLLQWDSDDYGGVDTVRVPSNKIWKPDIVLYNYADERLKEHRDAMATVGNTGEVMWIPMAIFKSVCPIDITHFPFDEQRCRMKFGSWSHDGGAINVSFLEGAAMVDLNTYMESPEWQIVEAPAVSCPEVFLDLTYYIHIRRRGAFYNYILILPCILLSTLTLVLFWLPPESPAKMQLGMNIFVAIFYLLLLLADSTPPAASKIPLIGVYYCLNMITIALSTFLSVIVINLYFRGDRKNRIPRWIKRIMIDHMAHVLCMATEIAKNQKAKDAHKRIQQRPKPNFGHFAQEAPNLNDSPDGSPVHLRKIAVETKVHEIFLVLKALVKRMEDKEATSRVVMEWRLAALVLDRILFFFYLVLIIVSLGYVFPKMANPNINESEIAQQIT